MDREKLFGNTWCCRHLHSKGIFRGITTDGVRQHSMCHFFFKSQGKESAPPWPSAARQSNGADSVRGTLKKSDTWSGERWNTPLRFEFKQLLAWSFGQSRPASWLGLRQCYLLGAVRLLRKFTYLCQIIVQICLQHDRTQPPPPWHLDLNYLPGKEVNPVHRYFIWANPDGVEWKGLPLEEPPSWSWWLAWHL